MSRVTDKWSPIFDEHSTSVSSKPIYIAQGDIGIFQAFGFADYREPATDDEAEVPQLACINMLLLKEVDLPNFDYCCSSEIDLSKLAGVVMVEETLISDDCKFSLSACNNYMMINIPGSYRFVLNDDAAIGVVKIYWRTMPKDTFRWDSRFFMGA